MTLKFGMVMDSIDRVNINKDTSFAMLLAAQKRGWHLYYMELNDLFLRNGQAFARIRLITVERASVFYQVIEEKTLALAELDVIIMRKDPPFNQEYIYATYLLEQAERAGCYIVNKPQSLRDANEKLFTAWFPECCTDTLVTRNHGRIKDFLVEHQQIILKPLDGMGGASIFHLKIGDPNLAVILETMTAHESCYVMAQKYLPEIKAGDKRILLINGEPVPYALARIPAIGETRGNLAAGGRAKAQPLSPRDLWIAEQVGETLKQKGLVFVGLDVIGDFITEINVTSPTCVQELDRAYNLDIAGQLMDHIEQTISL
ncbi:MAG: glutathione synthase [Methylococcales bacterium]|nr:glutathione synthase [Methylococcales bacterium]